jgi:outer membrane immunogenic protein
MSTKLCLASAAAAVLTLTAVPALAQDGPNVWNGPYVGVNGGYGGGSFTYPYAATTDIAGANPVSGKLKQDSSGALGGVTLGYNYQMTNGPALAHGLVFGLETDIAASDIGAQASYAGVQGAGNSYADLSSRIDYLGTARARIGKPMFNNRLLPYVTGGYAYGGVRTVSNVGCSYCAGAANDTYLSPVRVDQGWTAGAGAEYALTPHLSMKAEYLYVDLDARNLGVDGGQFSGPGFTVYNADANLKPTANIVRVGFNWRF